MNCWIQWMQISYIHKYTYACAYTHICVYVFWGWFLFPYLCMLWQLKYKCINVRIHTSVLTYIDIKYTYMYIDSDMWTYIIYWSHVFVLATYNDNLLIIRHVMFHYIPSVECNEWSIEKLQIMPRVNNVSNAKTLHDMTNIGGRY